MVCCAFEKCKKKLTFVEETIKCRCKLSFCGKHRIPNNHSCNFDYKKMVLEQLKKNEIDLTYDKKIIRI